MQLYHIHKQFSLNMHIIARAKTSLYHTFVYLILSFLYLRGSDPVIFALTLRVDRELSIAMTVGEHARGIKLPQGAFSALLRRACEDLVVVGEAQQTHHFRERQVDAGDRSPK